jgi:cytochrome c oxidase subunit 4
MEQSHSIDIKKHVRTYIVVFVALLGLTFVTVAVSYWHLPISYAVVVALIIATIKGSLVASFFMHLISEKKLIYLTLVLTFIFFLALIFLPVGAVSDKVVN